MWFGYSTLILRMKLHTNKPGVVFQFNDLHKVLIGVNTHAGHTIFFVFFKVLIVELVPVPVSLRHIHCLIYAVRKGILLNFTGVFTEPHCPTQPFDLFLFFHQIDDWIFGVRVHLGGMSALVS